MTNRALTCMTVQERAAMLSAERRGAILASLGAGREGGRRAPGRGARRVRGRGPARSARASPPRASVHRVHGGALAARAAARVLAHRRGTRVPGQGGHWPTRAVRVLAGARVILLDGATTNLEVAQAAARRPCLHRPDQLAADRRRARRPSHCRGRGHRRAPRQGGAGHRGRRGRRLPPHRARRRLRARRVRLPPDAGLSTDDLEEAHVKRAMVGGVGRRGGALPPWTSCAPPRPTSSPRWRS